MVIPLKDAADPSVLHDKDGNPIDSVLTAGVRRLRVDSAGGGGTAPLNTVTFAAPTFFTAGAASLPAVAADATRKALILSVTTAGARISLGFGAAPAVLDSGITVFTGTPVVLDAALMSVQAVNIIASGAGVNVAIQAGA